MMSDLKRAHSWEISDSETEDGGGTERTERAPVPAVRSPSPGERSRESRGENRGLRERRKEERVRQKEEKERQKEERVRQKEEKERQKEERVRQKEEKERQKEERVRQKEEKERQREEKETQREERVRQKEEKERQREERVRQREERRQEQAWRRKQMDLVRKLKPEEYLKSLTIHIHPVLLQDSGCDVLLNALASLEWRNRIEEQELTHTISWTRHTEDDDEGEVEEDQVLMVISQEEFMDMRKSIKQMSEGAESLFPPLCEYLNRNSHSVITLLVTGHPGVQRESSYDDHDDGVCPRSQLGLQDVDIEEVLVYLQLYKNVSVHFLFGWQEVTDHVCAVTKALSKRPYKKQYDGPDLGFCLDGSWAGGVRVEKSGCGLAQVWTRQVQQLNRVSVAMATAVTSAYPSPHLLLQAYEEAESEEEQRRILADLTVRGGAGERRIGPELSNRLLRLMTSQNPELVLD